MRRYCLRNCGKQTTRPGRVCLTCDPTRWERAILVIQGSIVEAAARSGLSRGHVSVIRSLVHRGKLRPPSPPRPAPERPADRFARWLALHEQGLTYEAIADREGYVAGTIGNGVRRARKARQ